MVLLVLKFSGEVLPAVTGFSFSGPTYEYVCSEPELEMKSFCDLVGSACDCGEWHNGVTGIFPILILSPRKAFVVNLGEKCRSPKRNEVSGERHSDQLPRLEVLYYVINEISCTSFQASGH